MANSNQVELVVTVEVDKANQSIKSVNANLSGIEAAATKSARGASQGIDGMTASMVKGAAAGNLLADAIKKAIEFAKEWTIEAAKEDGHLAVDWDHSKSPLHGRLAVCLVSEGALASSTVNIREKGENGKPGSIISRRQRESERRAGACSSMGKTNPSA